MVDVFSEEAIRDQKENTMYTLCTGFNDIKSRMYFDETGKYQYLTYDRQKCGGYVSIVPFNIGGSIQYRQMTFDELHNAVIALLKNPKATTIHYINSQGKDEELNTTDKAAIRQIIAQYFYICSRMESDLDLIIMEKFWQQRGYKPIENTEKLKNPLVELNKQLHVKLDLKKLSVPVSRESFYHKLYVATPGKPYVKYEESTRDAKQFGNVISKIEAVYKQLEIAPTTKAAGPLDDSAIKYEYIKAASSVMSHSKATVDGQEIPVGITCNIPFSRQTYAFEAVKDLCETVKVYEYSLGDYDYCSYQKPKDCESTPYTRFELLGNPKSVKDNFITGHELERWQHPQLTELLKTLYLNRILSSKGKVITIGIPLNFIDALAPDSKILYKKIAREVLEELVNNAEKYGIKDKLIVADGFNTQDTPQLIERGDVRLVFAAEKQYPITELAGKFGDLKNNISNYNEIQVYQSGDIVLVNNSSKEGEPKYCVNGQVNNPQTKQSYTEKDIEKFGKPICTYEVKEVSLDALGDHLGAVGRYCSNEGGDSSADGIITGLPGVIDGLYGLGNPYAIADYQKKYTELQEIVKSKDFVEPEKAKIEMLPSFTAKAPSQPQPEPQAFDAKAIAKQIFDQNRQKNCFDFNKFAKVEVLYNHKDNTPAGIGDVVISLLQIINQEKYTTTRTENGLQLSAEIDLSEDRNVILGVGNEDGIQYNVTNKFNTSDLKQLLTTILNTLDIKEYDLSKIEDEQAKQVFGELLNLLHKELKPREIKNLIFAKTIEFLKTEPTKRQELAVELKDISAAFLRNLDAESTEIINAVSRYLNGLKHLDLSKKNIFDQIEEVFAYYRENGADNLNTNQMLGFYGAFYNAVGAEEKSDDTFSLTHNKNTYNFKKLTEAEKAAQPSETKITDRQPLTYKIIEREGKKFIVLNPNFLKDFFTLIENGGSCHGLKSNLREYSELIYDKIKEEDRKDATLVVPGLTDLTSGGHYVAYVYPELNEKEALNSVNDGRQESSQKELHFDDYGVKGVGFCGLLAVEAAMALTTGVQLIGKNRKDVKYFEIDVNGNTTSSSKERKLLVQPRLEEKEEIEEKGKSAESISEDEETPNTHFVPQGYEGKLLSKDLKFLHISNTGLKIKSKLKHKDSNFVIVNAGNGDIESKNLCLKLGGSGLNRACGNLYFGERGLINKKIKEVSKEAIDKGFFKISEYAKGKFGKGRYVGCIFVQLEEQEITHLYAIGPRYEDFRDKDEKVNKKHFFEDLKFTNDAIFGEITSHYTELTGKTIFFSGVSNNIFAGDLQDIGIEGIQGANIVDYFNAFCFMQFIQEHGDELEQHNIHIYLNKSISVALEALYNEKTRQSVLDFLNEHVQTEEHGFELLVQPRLEEKEEKEEKEEEKNPPEIISEEEEESPAEIISEEEEESPAESISEDEEESPAESISEDEETPNTHFVPEGYEEKPLSEDLKFLHISNTGLKIKPELNHKNSNFVIVNKGNGDPESPLYMQIDGTDGACAALYGEQDFSKYAEYFNESKYTNKRIGCVLFLLSDEETQKDIKHFYAIGPNYNDYTTGTDEEKKQHFFEDLEHTNNAIFGQITSHYTELTGKTIFFSGVSNDTFAGEELKQLKIESVNADANIVDYYNAFCFMQFIQEHRNELEQYNIHIYLDKSISVALEALYNEETRQLVLDFLNEHGQTEEQKEFSYNPKYGFELKKKEDDEGDSGDGGYDTDGDDDIHKEDKESIVIESKPENPTTKTVKPQPEIERKPVKSTQSKIPHELADQKHRMQEEKFTPLETRDTLRAKPIEGNDKVWEAVKSLKERYDRNESVPTKINSSTQISESGQIRGSQISREEAAQRSEVLQKIYQQYIYENIPITPNTRIDGVNETTSRRVVYDLFENAILKSAENTCRSADVTLHDFEIIEDEKGLVIQVKDIGNFILPPEMRLEEIDDVIQLISQNTPASYEKLRSEKMVKIQSEQKFEKGTQQEAKEDSWVERSKGKKFNGGQQIVV